MNDISLTNHVDNLTIHFSVPVWGKKYVEKYLQYSLPSQLASENLPIFSNTNKLTAIYHFYTTKSDKKTLSNSPLFADLSSYVDVLFHDINDLPTNDGQPYQYFILNRCQEDNIRIAAQNNDAMIFLFPDIIIANGTILFLCDKLVAGYQLVLTGNLRVVEETIQKELDHARLNSECTIDLTGDEFCRLAIKHAHPRVNMTCTNSYLFDSSWPDFLYWTNHGDAMVQRGLFLIPFAMIVKKEFLLDNVTLDINPVVYECCPDPKHWYVCEDSRELLTVTSCKSDEFEHMVEKIGIFNPIQVADWMLNHLSQQQIDLLQKTIRICPTGCEAELDDLVERSDRDIATILAAYELLAKHPNISTEIHLMTTLSGQGANWLREIPPKVNRLIASLKGRSLVVYGSGAHTQLLLRCTNLRCCVTAISDSNAAMWGKKISGINCIPPNKIADISNDIIISSRAFEEEIYQKLTERYGDTIKIHSLYQ